MGYVGMQLVNPRTGIPILLDGATPVLDLNRTMNWNLPVEATTLAGFLIHEANSIPDVGQVFAFHGFRFEVVGKARNRITALKVTPLNARNQNDTCSREATEAAPSIKNIPCGR